jgi:predicted dehydrogenase
MAHFVECVRDNRKPLTSPEEQIGSLRTILAAYRSVESGRAVKVADV